MGDKNKNSTSRINELEERLEQATQERDEYLEGWKRSKADLVNFKRETAETMNKIGERAKKDLLRSIIPTLEAFNESAKSDIEGLSEIHTLLLQGLKEQGVEEIVPQKGDALNPQMHEAVEGEGDVIEEVLRKGYALDGTTIKPAMVRVKKA